MYLPHINIKSTPTTTNSTTYIKPSSPSYTIDTALRHNTRLISKNKELQDTIENARRLYKILRKERNQLSTIIDIYLPEDIKEYKSYLKDDPTIPEEIQELFKSM